MCETGKRSAAREGGKVIAFGLFPRFSDDWRKMIASDWQEIMLRRKEILPKQDQVFFYAEPDNNEVDDV